MACISNSVSQAQEVLEEVDLDDGLDEPSEANAREDEAIDALSAQLARELHAQLNNLRPRRQ